ncbi:MAG: outer membrane beta-barrel protein [Bacteroidota bacterium]
MSKPILIITFVCSIFFFSKNCNSQSKTYFGLCGGISYFKFKEIKNLDVYIADYQGKLNYNFGFSFLIKVNKNITFNTALKFANKSMGVKWKQWTFDSLLNIHVIDRSKIIEQFSFEIPVKFSFYPNKNSKLFFDIAASLSNQIKNTLDNDHILGLNDEFENQLGFDKVNLFIEAGLGYKINCDNSLILIEPYAGIYIPKLYDKATFENNGNPVIIGINLQYLFSMN